MNKEKSLLDSIRRVIRRTADELKKRNPDREEPIKELPPDLPYMFQKRNIDINTSNSRDNIQLGSKKPNKIEDILSPGYTKSTNRFTKKSKE
jgi:hypothetical protein